MANKKNGAETAGQAKISKQEGVRRALAELGNDAKPSVIQGFVKDRFGIEMNKDHISVCKGKELRKKAGKGKKAAHAPPAALASPAPKGKGKGGIVLEDILAVKALAERVGADQLRTLIDTFAK